MFPTFRTDEVTHFGRIGNGFLAGLNLAVKDAQGVGLKPPLTIFTELKRLLGQEFFQFFPVPGPAGTIAQGY